MDYVVGSVAALISGNVTPSRPRVLKRALTPTKHQPSPNVTPKSELVDDRSIFLSPTLQKKKAIVKKSPKRIFQTPDLDVTNEGDGNSGKADKVKKHLEEELDADKMVIKSPRTQKNAIEVKAESVEIKSPKKKSKNIEEDENFTENTQIANESTPKKKKKQRMSLCSLPEIVKNQEKNSIEIDIRKVETEGTPKKIKKVKKKDSKITDYEHEEFLSNVNLNTETIADDSVQTTPKKKKNKKNKKSKTSQILNITENTEKSPDEQDGPTISKKKRKLSETVSQEPNFIRISGVKPVQAQNNDQKSKKKNKRKKKSKQTQNEETDESTKIQNQEPTVKSKPKKKNSNKNIVNPNAITNKDSDSEHESDNEINSETEEANNEILNNGSIEESSDDEEVENETKMTKKKAFAQKPELTEINMEEELKRTLFVGNVAFTPSCKREIKKIFMHYGAIDSIRIRAVPVKDARLTPKLAVIKNELHPERSTVNVYIKYKHAESVDKALAENNTLFMDKHLRVTRSDSTGDGHDPKASIFVGNLPFALEDEGLREKFEKCGEIESVRIVRDKRTNIGKGFGYVNFTSKDAVELALALTDEDLTIKNRILRVKRCTHTNKRHDRTPDQSVNSQRDFNSRGRGFNSRGRGFNNRGGRGLNRGGQRSFNDRGDRGFNSRGASRGRGGHRGGRGGQNFSRGGQRGFNDRSGDGQASQGFQGRSDRNDIGAFRRIQNKRQHQEGGSDGPPNKRPKNINQPGKEKKARKEFVGMTAEKKKKRKNSKSQGLRQKKALSEILSK